MQSDAAAVWGDWAAGGDAEPDVTGQRERPLVNKRILHAFQRAQFAIDPDTARHSARVGAAAAALGTHLGLGRQEADMLRAAGIVHDLGKLAVQPEVLAKPTPLTPRSVGHNLASVTFGDGISEGGP